MEVSLKMRDISILTFLKIRISLFRNKDISVFIQKKRYLYFNRYISFPLQIEMSLFLTCFRGDVFKFNICF